MYSVLLIGVRLPFGQKTLQRNTRHKFMHRTLVIRYGHDPAEDNGHDGKIVEWFPDI